MPDLTDAEITAACARAMGIRRDRDGGYLRLVDGAGCDDPFWFPFIYNPLHDKAQALDLVIQQQRAKEGGNV